MKARYLLFMLLIFPLHSNSLLKVDITRGNTSKIPISIANCSISDKDSNDIVNIIKNDLNTSSIFEVAELKNPICRDDVSINNADVKTLVLILKINSNPDNKKDLEVKTRLIDSSMQKQLIGKSFSAEKVNYRKVAHTVADNIYTKITGERGYFNTKIAYIAEHKNLRKLAVIDQDGANNQFLTDGKTLILTPRFFTR